MNRVSNRLSRRLSIGLSSMALRTCGILFLATAVVGVCIIQNSILKVDDLTNEALLELMQEDSSVMMYSTMALVGQALEACAVPIFAFLLVEGTTHTSSFKNYLLRVLGLALACEIPYNLAMSGTVLDFGSRNPVFGLVMSMVMLYFFRHYREKTVSHYGIKITAIVGTILWGGILGITYAGPCVILVAVLWGLRGKQNLQTFLGCMACICCSLFSIFFMVAPASFLVIHFYNGEQGAGSKWLKYLSYPVILLVCWLISLIIK